MKKIQIIFCKIIYIILFIILIYNNLIIPLMKIKNNNISLLSVIGNILIMISFITFSAEIIQKLNEKNNEIQYFKENK